VTFVEFKEAISSNVIPVLFQEAATICKELGIDFLWIDSICILQDDEDDWSLEAAKIAFIYENAAIVIAASTAATPGNSFLSTRSSLPKELPLRYKETTGNFTARISSKYGLHSSASSV
jgi:hypothetical protein